MAQRIATAFCLLFLAQAFATRDMSHSAMRELMQTTAESGTSLSIRGEEGTTVSARAAAQAFSAGGVVTAHAEATGEAITEVADAFAKVVATAVADVEAGGNADAVAKATAEAFAEAVAEAYTNVILDISSDTETGRACASGFSDAEATATAFARAYVEVLAEASNFINFASASAAAEAISAATASAYATAEAEACGEGVFNAAIVAETFSQSIVNPFVIVGAKAFAAVTKGAAAAVIDVTAESLVDEQSTSDSSVEGDIEGVVDVDATADGGATTTPVTNFCDADEFRSCCRRPRSRCSCGSRCTAELDKDSRGATDTAFGYVVTRDRRASSDAKYLGEGFQCLCA